MSHSILGRALLVLGTAVALALPQVSVAQNNEFAEPLTALANAQLRADSVHANAAGYAQFGDGPVGTRKNTGLLAKGWKLPF